jgi:hypothetical protein
VWDALGDCPVGAADTAPADVGEALDHAHYVAGLADDGTVVLGTVDCDRVGAWSETITHGPARHDGKRAKVKRQKAATLAKPAAWLSPRRVHLGRERVGDLWAERYDAGGVSLLGLTTCDVPPEKRRPGEEPEALDFTCTSSLLVRGEDDHGPGGVVHTLVEEFFWDPRNLLVASRSDQSTIVAALVKGGDHGCGSYQLTSWAGPEDLSASLVARARSTFDAGRRGEAIAALEVAVRLAPDADGARWELARACAREGAGECAARALGPMLVGDPKERARWVARIDEDRAFDPVREQETFKPLVAPP